MSFAITLDPEKTARFEPVERTELGSSFIALTDIPNRMMLTGVRPQIIAIGFDYPYDAHRPIHRKLDELDKPDILVTYEANSRRIRRLQFSKPIDLDDMAEVADRIVAESKDEKLRLSAKYNHLMVAAIIKNYKDFLGGFSTRLEEFSEST